MGGIVDGLVYASYNNGAINIIKKKNNMEIHVTEKKVWAILAYGKPDAYLSNRVHGSEAVNQLITDVNELGKTALVEKYFSDIPEDSKWIVSYKPRIWINGDGMEITFSDETKYFREDFEGDSMETMRANQGYKNYTEIFGKHPEKEDIFPEIHWSLL